VSSAAADGRGTIAREQEIAQIPESNSIVIKSEVYESDSKHFTLDNDNSGAGQHHSVASARHRLNYKGEELEKQL
jgi:hypothetical protein